MIPRRQRSITSYDQAFILLIYNGRVHIHGKVAGNSYDKKRYDYKICDSIVIAVC